MEVNVPEKEAGKILYSRGVSESNVNFLNKAHDEQGYKTVGEFLNAIIQPVKKSWLARKARGKQKKHTPIKRRSNEN